MATDLFLVFLAIGVVMILADAALVFRSGRRYLASAEGEAAGGPMTRLVAVLFLLVMFAALALLAVFDLEFGDGNSIRAVVGNLGVLLLVLALVHAGMIALLSNLRDNQVAEEHLARGPSTGSNTSLDAQRGPIVAPAADERGRDR